MKGNLLNGRKYIPNPYQQGVNTKDIVRTQTTPTAKKQTKHFTKKWAEDSNRHFPKEYLQIANRQIKSCSTTLILSGKCNSKTTREIHFTSCYNGDYQKS